MTHGYSIYLSILHDLKKDEKRTNVYYFTFFICEALGLGTLKMFDNRVASWLQHFFHAHKDAKKQMKKPLYGGRLQLQTKQCLLLSVPIPPIPIRKLF